MVLPDGSVLTTTRFTGKVFFDVVIADRLVKYRLQNQRTESFFNDM